MSMGTEAQVHDRVRYIGCVQSQVSGHDDPRGVIDLNAILTVVETRVGGWSSDLLFREVNGAFNSACFVKIEQDFVNGFLQTAEE